MQIHFLVSHPVLLAVLAVSTIVICVYHAWCHAAFRGTEVTPPASHPSTPGVSVIICAKNAGNQLMQTVQSVLDQDYPDFELIVVDDFSTDDSFRALQNLRDHRLTLLKASADRPGKKAALTTGILRAKGPYILLTDADCLPASPHWITGMASKLASKESCEMVLGYGPLGKTKGWLNRFSRFETTWTAVQYMSWALAGLPYMGVGRNLMYKKSLWERHMGFERHAHILSGDDDLFVSQAAHGKNTVIQMHPDTFVFSESRPSWGHFLKQKSRHISTSIHYQWLHKIILSVVAGSYILFWMACLIFIILDNSVWYYVIILVMIKWAVQMLTSISVFGKLQVSDLLPYYPFLDMALPVYQGILAIYTLVRKKGW